MHLHTRSFLKNSGSTRKFTRTYFYKLIEVPTTLGLRELTSYCSQINALQRHRLRINRLGGQDFMVAQQLWRQIFPLWISRAGGKGVFEEETEERIVPFSTHRLLHRPLSPSASARLPSSPNPTFQLPSGPPHSPSWSSHGTPQSRDAAAALSIPAVPPRSTGKNIRTSLFVLSLSNATYGVKDNKSKILTPANAWSTSSYEMKLTWN